MDWRALERLVQRAGMTRPGADTFSLDRLFAPVPIQIPYGLRIEEGPDGPGLAWDHFQSAMDQPKYCTDERGMLTAFGRLADAGPERILAFAKRYGVLYLCEHGLPDTHHRQPYPVTDDFRFCTLLEPEPISLWRRYARQVRGMMAVAGQLHRGNLGNDADWADVWGWSPESDLAYAPWWERSIERDRSHLAGQIGMWLDVAGVRVGYEWEGDADRPTITLSGGGMFGAVLRQLAFVVAKQDGLVVCAGCGAAFVPSRRPRMRDGRPERSWCDDCRDKGAHLRQAKRDQRARERVKGPTSQREEA